VDSPQKTKTDIQPGIFINKDKFSFRIESIDGENVKVSVFKSGRPKMSGTQIDLTLNEILEASNNNVIPQKLQADELKVVEQAKTVSEIKPDTTKKILGAWEANKSPAENWITYKTRLAEFNERKITEINNSIEEKEAVLKELEGEYLPQAIKHKDDLEKIVGSGTELSKGISSIENTKLIEGINNEMKKLEQRIEADKNKLKERKEELNSLNQEITLLKSNESKKKEEKVEIKKEEPKVVNQKPVIENKDIKVEVKKEIPTIEIKKPEVATMPASAVSLPKTKIEQILDKAFGKSGAIRMTEWEKIKNMQAQVAIDSYMKKDEKGSYVVSPIYKPFLETLKKINSDSGINPSGDEKLEAYLRRALAEIKN